MRQPRTDATRAESVLAVEQDHVEWSALGPDGRARYGRAEVRGDGPSAIAAAAAELAARVGGRRRGCVLALGPSLLLQRQLSFPDLGRKELRRAMLRKAANLVSAELGDTLFSAQPMEDGAQDDDQHSWKWLLLAQRRDEAVALRMALRRRGLGVARVVSTRMAPLACADRLGEPEGARIVVGVEPKAACVQLVARGALWSQSVLQGDFSAPSALAASLLQELRTFEASWRKRSRGEAVAGVVLVGLGAEMARHLEPALHAALAKVEVLSLPGTEDTDEHAARLAVLDACRFDGGFQPDLRVPLAPKTSTLAACTAALSCAAALAGFQGRSWIDGARAGLEELTSGLLSDAAGLAELERANALVEDEQARLAVRLERARLVGGDGLPLGALLEDAFGAFEGRAALLSLSASPGRMGLGGVADPHPVRSMAALDELCAALERSPRVAGVELHPPTVVPRESGASALQRGLHFDLDATLGGGR